jgi:hypothetical protein
MIQHSPDLATISSMKAGRRELLVKAGFFAMAVAAQLSVILFLCGPLVERFISSQAFSNFMLISMGLAFLPLLFLPLIPVLVLVGVVMVAKKLAQFAWEGILENEARESVARGGEHGDA